MSDQGIIVRELARAGVQGEAVVLASVVRTAGSAYRGVGTRMVVRADGAAVGLVSGGCLEADLVARAPGVRERATPELVTYDTRSADDLVWGLGLGCDGMVQVLLEPLAPEAAASLAGLLSRAVSGSNPSVLATVVSSGGSPAPGARLLMDASARELARAGDWPGSALIDAIRDRAGAATTAGRRGAACEIGDVVVALELVTPPVHVVICGSGADAVPVVELAAGQGWSVTVVDHRPVAHARPERFPMAMVVECADPEHLADAVPLTGRRAAVVMSHHYPRDLEYVDALLRSRVPYVGVLGPRRRTERMMAELAERGRGMDPLMLERLHGPVGLDIGGDGPEAVALSIVAEISAVMSGRVGGHLRDRRAPIHDVSTPSSVRATVHA